VMVGRGGERGGGSTDGGGEDDEAGPVVFDEFAHGAERVVELEMGWRGGRMLG